MAQKTYKINFILNGRGYTEYITASDSWHAMQLLYARYPGARMTSQSEVK